MNENIKYLLEGILLVILLYVIFRSIWIGFSCPTCNDIDVFLKAIHIREVI